VTASDPLPTTAQDDYVVGSSAAALGFERDLRQVAASDVTVLLEGESGSGKGAAARRLHALSPLAAGPFVEVSLAALAPTLLEAELFGHEQGAFTGAVRAREGRFLRARGGTLVLDAVEILPEEVQVKLLRALQERVVEPLGAESPLPFDARILATSGRELGAEVGAGRFREDLYYRLAVVVLRLPPLRTRSEDLPDLVATLARRIARRSRVAPRPFAPAALARLSAWSWPGNVRELENAVERVLVLAPGERGAPVGADELAFLGAQVADERRRLAREALALGMTADEMGLALVEEALAEERGNVSAAARRLGLTRRALEYRRQRAGAEGEERE